MTHFKKPTPLTRKGLLTEELAYLLERDEDAFSTTEHAVILSVDDLPEAQNGEHRLRDSKTYLFVGTVDLQGNCLIAGQNTVIRGINSVNSIVLSTGLNPSTPLITTTYSLPIKDITLEANTVFDCNASGNSNQRVVLDNVEFKNAGNVGTIQNYELLICTNCLSRNCAGLVLDGTFNFILFSDSIYEVVDGGTGITLPSTATFNRFRVHTTGFALLGAGAVGINADVNVTCPLESYIIQSSSFSGPGTPIQGLDEENNKSLFLLSRGIENSSTISQYYMIDNATVTDITATNTFVKIAGTTLSGPLVRKFTNTNNRATYTGAFNGFFKVTAVLSASAGNSQELRVRIAKNGVPLPVSEVRANTPAAGTARSENIKVQTIIDLAAGANDYIEVWIANTTQITDITVTNLNVIVENLNL